MMALSQKCQYAVRAVFELARRSDGKPTSITHIAEAQAIPSRFLEMILGELRHGGFVESRRGRHGGYLLRRKPELLGVGEIIRFVEGPFEAVKCSQVTGAPCPMRGDCPFKGLWVRVEAAVSKVLDSTTYRDLLEEEESRESGGYEI